MITFELLITEFSGLEPEDLDRWIVNEWIKPDGDFGHYMFRQIDVARVRLIQELRDDMEVNEAALPVVLSLLDQLYDLRRRMRELDDGMHETVPAHIRNNLAAHLGRHTQ